MTDSPNYCPYCNQDDCEVMSDEHVIPKSIGGDNGTVIRVCKSCNDRAGDKLDPQLGSDGWNGVHALFCGVPISHRRKLPSTVTLKDGSKLDGIVYYEQIDNVIQPEFRPQKYQPDGSKWLREDFGGDESKLPKDINIFRRSMVKWWGLNCPPRNDAEYVPALVKILLATVYIDLGQDVVSSPAFDVLRSCLTVGLHERTDYAWIDGKVRWGDSVVENHQHAFWFESPEGKTFKGGVVLFGVGIKFSIDNFGVALPNRCCLFDGRNKDKKLRPKVLW
jgi:hypothetical protein